MGVCAASVAGGGGGGVGWGCARVAGLGPLGGLLLAVPGRWFWCGLYWLFWCQSFGGVTRCVCSLYFWFGLGCWVAAIFLGGVAAR